MIKYLDQFSKEEIATKILSNLSTLSMIEYNSKLYKVWDILDVFLDEELHHMSFSTKDIELSCRLDTSNNEYVFVTVIRTDDGNISSVEKFPAGLVRGFYDMFVGQAIREFGNIDNIKTSYRNFCINFKNEHNL